MADVNKSVNISFNASTQNLEQNLKKIPDITDAQAKKAASELDKNFKDMEKSADKTSKSISGKMKSMGKSFAAVGAAVAATGAVAVAFGQHLADMTNELVDASTKTGIAVETLAGLRLAAEGSGLAFSTLEGGLNQFQVRIADASAGSASMVAIFDQLGVQVNDASVAMRSSNDVFNDTVKALQAMENTTERNAIALKLLGEGGGAGLIQSGALDNLQAMTDLATQFGISVGDDAVNAMGTFQRKVAEFTTVATGELSRVIESVAGAGSLNASIDLVTQAVVFMGSLTRDTLAVVGQSFENVFILAQAGYMAMTGDVERAQIIINDAGREQAEALENMSNMFERASDRVDEFNRLSAASTAPAVMAQTTTATQSATQAMHELSQASAQVADAVDEIGEFINDSILKNVELEQQVRDRLTPEYQKQINTIKELGEEIDAQIFSTELEIDLLIDAAQARKLNAKEQTQLLILADELANLEATRALNRQAEMKERRQLQKKTHQDRLEQIDEEKQAQIDAQIEAITEIQNNINTTADLGHTIVNTVNAISDAISAVNQRQIDELRSKADAELKSIDDMVKQGVISAEQAAARRASIEAGYAEQVQSFKLKEFKINQASALASIAFDTAKAIAQALALPPVVRGATIAAVTAAGAAQAATVVAQPAPKFDVGGMVGSSDGAPDVVQANLLSGEAVLDRSTVASLGGAEGIRRLQMLRMGMMQPLFIQPFKHIDRYNRAIARQTPRRVGSGAY